MQLVGVSNSPVLVVQADFVMGDVSPFLDAQEDFVMGDVPVNLTVIWMGDWMILALGEVAGALMADSTILALDEVAGALRSAPRLTPLVPRRLLPQM